MTIDGFRNREEAVLDSATRGDTALVLLGREAELSAFDLELRRVR